MNVIEKELEQFQEHLNQYIKGKLDFEGFRKIRVWQGVYTYRGTSDRYMIRVKIPQGELNPTQLERLADLAKEHSQNGGVHITTRQDVELYGAKAANLIKVLRALAEVGLTTRETGGNGVRNVTACPFSGISIDEPFDVTPYARAVSQYFLRHPLTQHLPRKVKIAFEGCQKDHIRAMIHDIGAFAVKGNSPGFQLYVGGGLGGAPREAQLLEEFTPADQLLATIEAVLTVFNQHGGRESKDRARLKYLLQDWGIHRLRTVVQSQRQRILQEKRSWPEPEKPEDPPKISRPSKSLTDAVLMDPLFQRWLAYNVLAQKQPGFSSVFIRCPLGDISAEQLKKVAQISKEFCEGRVRTTITQNLLLRWIRGTDLVDLYQKLKPFGLTSCCAEHVMDITRCAGADSCLSALTISRGLATELGKLFSNGLSLDPEIFNMVIKISGCPHACGQHPIADLGFHGAAKTINGRQVPHYQILVGGYTERGKAEFAQGILMIPSKKVPMAVRQLLLLYLKEKKEGEILRDYVHRTGIERIRDELRPFTSVPSYDEDPGIYKDWGSDKDYKIEAKKGECSA